MINAVFFQVWICLNAALRSELSDGGDAAAEDLWEESQQCEGQAHLAFSISLHRPPPSHEHVRNLSVKAAVCVVRSGAARRRTLLRALMIVPGAEMLQT